MSREKMYSIDKNRLESVLDNRKLTKSELAYELGLNESTLNDRIREERLSESQLNAISAYLNISSGYITGASPYPIPYTLYESIRLEKENNDEWNDSTQIRPFVPESGRTLTVKKADRKDFRIDKDEIFELLFALNGYPLSAYQSVKNDASFFEDIGEVIYNHVHK